MSFAWDEGKAKANWSKHAVGFEEAATVFQDPLAAIFGDELHSSEERREIIIGHSARGRLLLVSFTERDGVIRVISSRQATRRERKDYEESQ